jgi:hypothetical protein
MILLMDEVASSKACRLTNSLNLRNRAMLQELTQLLEPFTRATNNLQGDGVTASLVYYEIWSLFSGYISFYYHKVCYKSTMSCVYMKSYFVIDVSRMECTFFEYLQIQLLVQVQSRFQEPLKCLSVIIPAILDPRQKQYPFLRNYKFAHRDFMICDAIWTNCYFVVSPYS